MLNHVLKKYSPGQFLELGYGGGDMLANLAGRGYSGCAFDSSTLAKGHAARLLSDRNIETVQLLDSFPAREKFDYIFFFELIGYLENPIGYLSSLKANLQEGGCIAFSFTNSKHAGAAERSNGNMACFTRNEIEQILRNAGYKTDLIVNYGFPLSNILKPLLHLYYSVRKSVIEGQQVARSGLAHKNLLSRLVGIFVNRYTLYPFSLLQLCFWKSDLGTGYIVFARLES